jgi:MFS family permease
MISAGCELFSWVTTLYVAAAVLGSIFVAMRPRGTGLGRSMLPARVMFAAGSLVCGLARRCRWCSSAAPSRGSVPGRCGAGLCLHPLRLSRTALAQGLDALCGDLGVSTLLGPSLGGVFSDGSAWRHAFMLLVPLGC